MNRLVEMIEAARKFRFCTPSADPDEQSAVTTGYMYVLVQIQHHATPLLPEAYASRLNAIVVDVESIYSAYHAKAQLDALLPDIEAAIKQADESMLAVGGSGWIIDPALIKQLSSMSSPDLDITFLVEMCREINSCFVHGNLVATTLLMRAVLNYVPPVFGQDTFSQVAAHIGRSLKDSFDHLENGLRKIADFHTHRRISATEHCLSRAQVEPYKPQFELLLQQVVVLIQARQQQHSEVGARRRG
jgi:hypothetical protein